EPAQVSVVGNRYDVRLGRRRGARVRQAGVDGSDRGYARSRATQEVAVGLVVGGVEGVGAGQRGLQVGLCGGVVRGLGHRQERRDGDRQQDADDEQDNEQLDEREPLPTGLLESEAPRMELPDLPHGAFLTRSSVVVTYLRPDKPGPLAESSPRPEGLEQPEGPFCRSAQSEPLCQMARIVPPRSLRAQATRREGAGEASQPHQNDAAMTT